MRIEDIKVGKTYQGASGQQKKVLSMEGFGRGTQVTFEVMTEVTGGCAVGEVRTRHIGPFALWAASVIEDK